MKFNHKKLMEKIYVEKLTQRTQTRSWLCRFMKLYNKQNNLDEYHILM